MSLTSYRAAPSRGNRCAAGASARGLCSKGLAGWKGASGVPGHENVVGFRCVAKSGAKAAARSPWIVTNGRHRTFAWPRNLRCVLMLRSAMRCGRSPATSCARRARRSTTASSRMRTAVHDYRKAMKRWRALLRLLEPFLGDDATAAARRGAGFGAGTRRRARRAVGDRRPGRPRGKRRQAVAPDDRLDPRAASTRCVQAPRPRP